MQNRYIRLLFLLFAAMQTLAQAPAIEWQKSYGGTGFEHFGSMVKTTDGGYIFASFTNSIDGDVSGNHGDYDIWVVKINNSGTIQWKKSLGGTKYDAAFSIIQTSDGGYAVSDVTYSNDGDVSDKLYNNDGDMWVVKLNSSGNTQWQKTVGSSNNDAAFSIIQTTDGGYVLAGFTGYPNYEGLIIKLNNSGNIQWQKNLYNNNVKVAYSIIQTSDGGYAIAGNSYYDIEIVKLNSSGDFLWQKTLGGIGYSISTKIIQTLDGGFLVGGYTTANDGDVSGNHGDWDIWIVKLYNNGNIEWQKTIGGSSSEYAYHYFSDDNTLSIIQASDGGFAIAGSTSSIDGDVTGNHGGNDAWLIKLNSLGDLEWQKTLGGTKYDHASSIVQSIDGSFTVAGISSSNDGNVSGNHGYSDIWVVKLSPPPFAIFPGRKSAICQTTTTLYAQGCTGAVNWYRDTNGAGTTYESLGTGNPKIITLNTNLEQFYRAKCTFFSNDLYGYSNYAVVRTGPVLTPQTYIVLPTVSKTFTASGCPAGTTYVWQHGTFGPNITKTGTIHSLYPATYFVRCESEDCISPSGFAYLYTADIAANPDNYTLNIDRPYTGNFATNDSTLSPKQIFIEPQPKHGYLSYDNSGAFLYTPLAGFKGIDSFEYYFTNSVGSFSNYGKVTLNVICPTVFPLTSPLDDTIAGLGIYKASSTSGTISATNKITGTAKVTYQAKIIELNAGFKADNGTVFTAEIGGCL